jgi:hypothetical protein
VKVPIRVDPPAVLIKPCVPASQFPPEGLTVNQLLAWSLDLSLTLEDCNADKRALQRFFSPR